MFLSLCWGDVKAYFTVCRNKEGFQNLNATEKVEAPTVCVCVCVCVLYLKKNKALQEKTKEEIFSKLRENDLHVFLP